MWKRTTDQELINLIQIIRRPIRKNSSYKLHLNHIATAYVFKEADNKSWSSVAMVFGTYFFYGKQKTKKKATALMEEQVASFIRGKREMCTRILDGLNQL